MSPAEIEQDEFRTFMQMAPPSRGPLNHDAMIRPPAPKLSKIGRMSHYDGDREARIVENADQNRNRLSSFMKAAAWESFLDR